MRGRSIPLSPVRKLVVDLTLLHVPSVPVQRIMNIAPLVAARVALADISAAIRHAKTVPVEEVRSFKRMLDLARWPWPLRRLIWWLGLNIGRQRGNYFGSYGISVYSGLGSESLHPISPLTGVLNYGVIGADGSVAVRIMYDHRVLDGATVARVLARIQEKLGNEVLDELKALRELAV